MRSHGYIIAYAIIILTISLTHVRTEQLKSSETIGELYENGVEAYLNEKYAKCITYIEQALDKYRVNRRKIQNCRLKCKAESESSDPLYPVDVEDLRFFEKAVKNTLCFINCRQANLGDEGNVGAALQEIFEKKTPYEYLNLCYYKMNDKQGAASAAFTYLVTNPNNTIMKKNLERYSKMPEVKMDQLVNFDAKDYVYLYIYGSDSYINKNWDSTINHMEESLAAYLQAEDECRADCEGFYDSGWHLDFIPSLANHFTYVLQCKRLCKKKLGSLNGEIYDDLLASHYDYLQYAYFKKGNLRATCEAVASYLLFLPNNVAMINNMKYYQKLPKMLPEYFTPREEAVKYIQRDRYEAKILTFIKEDFVFDKIPKTINDEAEVPIKAMKSGENGI